MKFTRRATLIGLSVISAFIMLNADLSASVRELARKLNNEGHRLYMQEDLQGALERFKSAVETDPTYGMAHYNLACTMALLLKEGMCEYDFLPDTVLEELELAVKFDPSRAAQIRNDPDLDDLKSMMLYYLLSGSSLKNEQDLRFILEQVHWQDPHCGAICPLKWMKFHPGGKISFWAMSFEDEEMKAEQVAEGSYVLTGTKIEVELSSPYDGHMTLNGEIGRDGVFGVIRFDQLDGYYYDGASWCSA